MDLLRPYTYIILALFIVLVSQSCRKDQDVLYQITDQNLALTDPGKNKLKSESQYIAILYANLFQRGDRRYSIHVDHLER